MNKEEIEHNGIVVDANPSFVTVEIKRSSACGACGAKSLCNASDSGIGLIEIPVEGYELFEKGENVKVFLKRSMGFKALWISYMIPLLVLILILAAMTLIKAPELVAGLSVIGGIAVYYFLVWLLRDKLKNEFIFTLEKIEKK